MSEQSPDIPQEKLKDAPEDILHELEDDDDDRLSITSESSSESSDAESSDEDNALDTTDTDTPAWLINLMNTVLSGSDDEEDEADLDDPKVMDQKSRQFGIKVDKCLAEALAAVSEKIGKNPEADK